VLTFGFVFSKPVKAASFVVDSESAGMGVEDGAGRVDPGRAGNDPDYGCVSYSVDRKG
jgi:hypothetical protein